MSRIILQSRRRGRGKNEGRKQPGHPSCSPPAHDKTVLALGYGRVLARLCGRVRMMRAGKDNLAIPFRVGRTDRTRSQEAAQKDRPARPQQFSTRPQKGGLVDPRLRASNEHLPSVRVPRAGGRPGYPSHSSKTARCTSTGDPPVCPLLLLPRFLLSLNNRA